MTAADDLQVRDATEADLDTIVSIRARSFGPADDAEAWLQSLFERLNDRRWLVVADSSGTVLAAGRILAFSQAWRGRLLPMGGVAGVYVEPSARGRGVATRLMGGLMSRMVELGDVVSCLFPTTAGLYRACGYEIGGAQRRLELDGAGLRSLARSLGPHSAPRPRPCVPDDAADVHALVTSIWAEQGVDGPTLPSAADLAKDFGDSNRMNYLCEGGYVSGILSDGRVIVDLMAARTAADASALWSLVGSGSSATPKVRAFLDSRDPVLLSNPSLPAHEVREIPWMARVIDLPAAVAARGCATAVVGSVVIDVQDEQLPGNHGTWSVAARGGSLTATRTDQAPELALSTRGLAALWCGWSVPLLLAAGLATGSPSPGSVDLLDSIFACEPVIPGYF